MFYILMIFSLIYRDLQKIQFFGIIFFIIYRNLRGGGGGGQEKIPGAEGQFFKIRQF